MSPILAHPTPAPVVLFLHFSEYTACYNVFMNNEIFIWILSEAWRRTGGRTLHDDEGWTGRVCRSVQVQVVLRNGNGIMKCYYSRCSSVDGVCGRREKNKAVVQ